MDNMKTLYFDFQATTPVTDEVLSKIQPYFSEFFANPHASDHVLRWKSDASVENAALEVASLMGAVSHEIIFTPGANDANELAIDGLARRAAFAHAARERILLGATEHKCILSGGRVVEEQYGYSVDYI